MGFDLYSVNSYRQGKGGAGGISILIRKSIKNRFFEVDQCNGLWDAGGIKIACDYVPINFICVYRRPDPFAERNKWGELFKNINGSEGIVILRDFNAHNTAWNCERTDTVGNSLLEEMEARDMFIVNSETKSRMGEVGQTDSNIDIIFCNDKVINLIDKYEQGEDSWGSDHFPIFVDFKIDTQHYSKKTNRISGKTTRWGKYIKILERKAGFLDDIIYEEMEKGDKYRLLIKFMIDAVKEASCKLRPGKKKIDRDKNNRMNVDDRSEEGNQIVKEKNPSQKNRRNPLNTIQWSGGTRNVRRLYLIGRWLLRILRKLGMKEQEANVKRV